MESSNEFHNVYQFFVDGSQEKLTPEPVSAVQAMGIVQRLLTSIGARIGTTSRVIITDEWDCTNFEWIYGTGVVYPTKEQINGKVQ